MNNDTCACWFRIVKQQTGIQTQSELSSYLPADKQLAIA